MVSEANSNLLNMPPSLSNSGLISPRFLLISAPNADVVPCVNKFKGGGVEGVQDHELLAPPNADVFIPLSVDTFNSHCVTPICIRGA